MVIKVCLDHIIFSFVQKVLGNAQLKILRAYRRSVQRVAATVNCSSSFFSPLGILRRSFSSRYNVLVFGLEID